jgi:Predicted membrane protein
LNSTNELEQARLATRRWELTNTRLLLGVAESEDSINKQIDPEKRRIRIVKRFRLVAKPGVAQVTSLDQIGAELDPAGPYVLYEFTGALPRAKFYEHWAVQTHEAAALKELASKSFDPKQRLIVNVEGVPGASAVNTNDNSAAVEFVRYSPRDVVLKSVQQDAGILLLNDRYDPNWKVQVDGRPEKLLRCNHFMRGVYLQPGSHTVEFRFQPPYKLIYVSLAAMLLGAVLLGAVIATGRRDPLKKASVPERNKFGPFPARVGEKRPQQLPIRVGK